MRSRIHGRTVGKSPSTSMRATTGWRRRSTSTSTPWRRATTELRSRSHYRIWRRRLQRMVKRRMLLISAKMHSVRSNQTTGSARTPQRLARSTGVAARRPRAKAPQPPLALKTRARARKLFARTMEPGSSRRGVLREAVLSSLTRTGCGCAHSSMCTPSSSTNLLRRERTSGPLQR